MSQAVLFDLDGCLADSKQTIVEGMRHALAVHGAAERTDAELVAVIGPPTRVAFGTILGLDPDAPEVDAVVSTYRERYQHDLPRTRAFDGVAAALDALRDAGLRLAVATSKPHPLALPVLDAIGLADRFEVVAGPSLDGVATKAETIAEALAGLGDGTDVVAHVGDREHDVEGAHAHGLTAVGVLWGFGSPQELTSAGADVVVERPAQLAPLLLDMASARRASRDSSSAQTGP